MGRWYTALIVGFVAGAAVVAAVCVLVCQLEPWTAPAMPWTALRSGRTVPWPFLLGIIVATGWVILRQVSREAVRAARMEWEQERAREAMDHAHRLEQLRHDFFNQLTVISALLQMGAIERCLEYVRRVLDPAAAGEREQGGSSPDEPPARPGERPPRGEL